MPPPLLLITQHLVMLQEPTVTFFHLFFLLPSSCWPASSVQLVCDPYIITIIIINIIIITSRLHYITVKISVSSCSSLPSLLPATVPRFLPQKTHIRNACSCVTLSLYFPYYILNLTTHAKKSHVSYFLLGRRLGYFLILYCLVVVHSLAGGTPAWSWVK